jgi:dienelactone hydrolase
MSCCPAEMEPPRAAVGGQRGLVVTHGQTRLFVAGPPKARAGVLAFPDVYGVDSGRAKQDAEKLGELGYVVAVVDLAHGNYMNSSTANFPAWLLKLLSSLGIVDLVMRRWLTKHSYEEEAAQSIKDALEFLHEQGGVETVSSYGYCWGSWIGAVHCTTDNPVVKGHVSFHPSWAAENTLHGDGAVEKLAERIAVPQLLLAASNDPAFVSGGGSVERVLTAKTDIGALCKVVDFPDAVHGWVNRGDLEDSLTKANVDEAWRQAIAFTRLVNPPA